MTYPNHLYSLFLDLFHNHLDGTVSKREVLALKSIRKAQHYSGNISWLLCFVLEKLQEYREKRTSGGVRSVRVALDLEKLLSDVRSFLDELYQVIIQFQTDRNKIPSKRRKSYGQFCEWFLEADKPEFESPLSILCEAVPWALDIRWLRDGYTHKGHESLIFYGDDELYLDPNSHRTPPRQKELPSLFYESGNAANILSIEKYLIFIIAPVLAIEHTIGEKLQSILNSEVQGWKHIGIGIPLGRGPEVFMMREWIMRNQDALDPSIYEKRYFGTN